MKKVFVVEDDKYFRENAKIALSRKGYEVYTYPTGEEAIEMVQSIHPDIILCDIMMPFRDGYWVLKQVRGNDEYASIPFVFMTAKVEQDDIKKGMDLGADDYLVKPFKLAQLIETIKKNLKDS